MLRRREFLASAGALGASASLGWPARAAGGGLGDIAASRGLLFGSWARGTTLETNPAYSEMIARECKVLVCGVEMFWPAVSPSPEAMELTKAEAVYAWAASHNEKFRGHTLVWHKTVPGWFAGLSDRDAAIRALHDHVHGMCKHFAGRMHSWDVVNEALALKPTPDAPMRESAFLGRIGPDFLDIAFRAAREGDPKALLVYNDYGFELDFAWGRAKQKALLDLLDDFRRRGTPIDAVGLQSHLKTEYKHMFNEEAFARFLKEVTSRGVKIMVTELDVADRGSPGDIAARDADVAGTYKRYLDVVLDNREVIAVIMWGLTDADSWIVRGDQPTFVRQDGQKPRPLPFDTDLGRKPAYDSIAQALRSAPAR